MKEGEEPRTRKGLLEEGWKDQTDLLQEERRNSE